MTTAEKKWVMPRPRRGQPVSFYHKRTRSDRNAELAFVSKVDQQSITVTLNGAGYSPVYHYDDPRLENEDAYREIMGTFKFLDDEEDTKSPKATNDKIRKLEARVKKLEDALGMDK